MSMFRGTAQENTLPQDDEECIIIRPSKGGWLTLGNIGDAEYAHFVKQYTLRKNQEIVVRIEPCGEMTPQAMMIADVLSQHEKIVTAQVPYGAGPAGTLIALACSQIVMSRCSYLSPISHTIHRLLKVNTQDVLSGVERSSIGSLGSVIALHASKTLAGYESLVETILLRRFEPDDYLTVKRFFTETLSNDTPLPLAILPPCVPVSTDVRRKETDLDEFIGSLVSAQ